MTSPETDEPAFADLLDELLAALLNGDEPNLVAVAARHPHAAHRIDEAYRLAGSVAGRRAASRPVLRGYEIVRELGRGGMGTVYLARQADLDRQVAIKVLPHSFGLSTHSRQRFLEEAKALARVQHDNIVGIHRIVDDGDLLAFEMEFVDGPSLQEVLAHLREVRAGGAVPTLQHVADLLHLPLADLGAPNLTMFFVRLGRAIGRALGAVHRAGFVHRDVKPANILLRQNGQPVLADFGLVRDTALELSHKTGFVGTPVYSSPEQLRGTAPIGPATDVYALGVTLYECLTLAPPFAGRTTTDLLSRIESGRIPPLRRCHPEAPRDLETILAHAMELEPPRRYRDGAAFADDLQRLLDLVPIQARPASLLRRAGKFVRRNRMPLTAGCLGAALVALGMLPVLDHVQAADRRLQIAQQEQRAARQVLLSGEVRFAAWQHGLRGSASRGPDAAAGSATAALQRCADHYLAALAAAPQNAAAARELAVVHMALWLRQQPLATNESLQQALASAQFTTLAAALPPLTARLARASVAGTTAALDVEPQLPMSDAATRSSFGLLAFLIGELRWCELAWEDLDNDIDEPLRDGVLGLLHLTDDAPERAYVRLRAAQRALPEAALALELADAAMAMGETQLARQWLGRAANEGGRAELRRRVQADLQLADGEVEAARATYEDLARGNLLDPTPQLRLAQLAIREGHLDAAEARLDDLLGQWPAMGRLRLDRARVALLRRDAPAYVRQVLAVLTDDLPQRSQGSAADLLEVLRIGGLDDLHRELRATMRAERGGRAFLGGELPLNAFLPQIVVDELQSLLPALAAAQKRQRQMVGAPLTLDPTTSWAFATAPLVANRLPGFATMGSPLRNLAFEALPLLVRHAYPIVQPLLRTLWISTVPSQWTLIDLTHVTPPADLEAELTFGARLVGGADWNGDGVRDLLLTAAAADPAAATGRVLLVDGRTNALFGEVRSDSRDHLFGFALAVLGDIDGDGFDEWLVGAPAGHQDVQSGYVEIRSGRDHRRLATVRDQAAAFGVAVTAVGDWNGDGCPDFAVGAPPILRNPTAQGRVTVYSGRTREVLRVIDNQAVGVWFGAELADVGDADGDGVHDLAVGGQFGDAPGRVVLYSGRTGAILQAWGDDDMGSGFGVRVCAVGDLDRDGHADVAVSAVRSDTQGGADRVLCYSGHTGRLLFALRSQHPGTRCGIAMTPYRVDGPDGPWLAISSPRGGNGGCGIIEFYDRMGQLLSTLQGPMAGSDFGNDVVVGDDIDGDGRPEVFTTSPGMPKSMAVHRIDSASIRFGR